jgi:SAM-dependent methyltransferase
MVGGYGIPGMHVLERYGVDKSFSGMRRIDISKLSNADRWRRKTSAYARLTRDLTRDSEYLRQQGLAPNILELIGLATDKRVLDAGCGTGWLFDNLKVAEAWECDLAPPPNRSPEIHSSCEDIRDLTFSSDFFDIVVSSLVLMWVDDLTRALRESFRVTKPGGHLVVGLVHPYFAHAGHVVDQGFLINQCLAHEREWSDYCISGVVGPLTYYYRRPETYYNEAVRAGWRLVQFRDWFVDMNHYSKYAGHRQSATTRTGSVPTFTFFVGEK